MEQSALYAELVAGCEWAAGLNPYPTEIIENPYPAADDPIAAGLALPWTGSYNTSSAYGNVYGRTTHPGGEFFPMLGCPSDGNARKADGSTPSPSNYAGCNGDSLIGFMWREQGERMAARGIFKPALSLRADTPATSYVQGGETSIATVTDGTSNTMAVSEVVVGIARDPGDNDIKRGVAADGTLALHGYPPQEGGGRPSTCAAVRAPGGEIRGAVLTLPKAGRWLDARSIYSIYKAALPPNSPSCVNEGPGNDNSAVTNANHISASSYHTGGVNVCMTDGAVRFVSDSIDAGDPTLKLGAALFPSNAPPDAGADGYFGGSAEGHRWMGESTYGVWGAIATPSHGESKSL